MRLGLFTFIILGLLSCHRPERFRPTINNTIYDSVGLLTKQQTDSIFGLIKELNDNVGSQIAVIIIDSLKGQQINEYSIRQAERLGVGRESYKDGILFTASLKERQMRIEVGYGLELIIKDEIASRINRQVIAPKFRDGNYGLGIYLGLDSIKSLIERNRELVGKSPKL
jgi:uncharacterized membrane protein YgcG